MTLTAAGWIEALEIINRTGSKRDQKRAARNLQRALNADQNLAREFERLNMELLASE